MKTWIKIVIIGVSVLITAIVAFYIFLMAAFGAIDIGKTDIRKDYSPNGEYSVEIEQVGEPGFMFGPVTAKITVRNAEGKKIEAFKTEVYNDGIGLDAEQWEFTWEEDRLIIVIDHHDTDDSTVTVPLK